MSSFCPLTTLTPKLAEASDTDDAHVLIGSRRQGICRDAPMQRLATMRAVHCSQACLTFFSGSGGGSVARAANGRFRTLRRVCVPSVTPSDAWRLSAPAPFDTVTSFKKHNQAELCAGEGKRVAPCPAHGRVDLPREEGCLRRNFA